MIPDRSQDGAQPLGQGDTAALDSDQRDVGAGFVAFGDFVANAGQGSEDSSGIEDRIGVQVWVGFNVSAPLRLPLLASADHYSKNIKKGASPIRIRKQKM